MQNYEIRITRPEGKAKVHAGRYLGDYHAIRRAHALARQDEEIEVWRGPHCIYRQSGETQRAA